MTDLVVPEKRELWLPRMPVAGPYYHGGQPGIPLGDAIRPHEADQHKTCAVCAVRAQRINVRLSPALEHPSVYITTDREYARLFASKWPRGDVYTVWLVGAVLMHRDQPFPVALCERVLVRGHIDTYVRLTEGHARRLTRRWQEAIDARAAAR